MIESVKETLRKVLGFHGIATDVSACAFLDYKNISKKINGVYLIVYLDMVIYVGLGIIKDRIHTHEQKALNSLKGAKDTDGWKYLRENYSVDLSKWNLLYVPIDSATGRSAVEGSLKHLLQPLANDECLKDREKLSKKAA